MRRPIVLLLLIVLGCAPALGQAPDTVVRPRTAAPATQDTIRPEPPLTPGGAFFRSLALPGWAQAELGAPERGAFYFLMEGVSLWMWVRTQQRLDHARRDQPADSLVIEARRQQREDWIALAIFWSLFSAADGWVSVHLYGFEARTGPPEEASIRVGWWLPF